MLKSILRIACCVLMLAVTVVAAPACAQKPEPEYADAITESILLAMNEGDYAGFTGYFDENTKSLFTEEAFNQSIPAVTTIIGMYQAKGFWKTEVMGQITRVYYKAKFTLEPGDVIVKVDFREIEGKIYVATFLLDSPKLRGG